jgi:CheY-like chemotaxis protein
MTTKNILIVDDQHEVRRVLRSGLESLGARYSILDMPSAEEAMLVLFRQKVDLLIVDFRLPGITGLEFMFKVRQRNPDVKVILITGVQDRQVRRKIAEAGAYAFFQKPVVMDDFLEMVEKALDENQEALLPLIEKQTDPSDKADPPLQETAREFDLNQQLEEIAAQAKAGAAAVWKVTGEISACAGKMPAAASSEAVLKQLAVLLQSSQALGSSLGPAAQNAFLHFSSKTLTVTAAPLDNENFLSIFTEGAASQPWQDLLPGWINSIQQGLAEKPPAVAEGLEVGLDETTLSLEAALEALEEVEISEEDLLSVEALFQTAPKEISTGELDNFWDTLVEGSELDGNIKDNALSYEEALRLGLTPGENRDVS